jgi:hypothetical protein
MFARQGETLATSVAFSVAPETTGGTIRGSGVANWKSHSACLSM